LILIVFEHIEDEIIHEFCHLLLVLSAKLEQSLPIWTRQKTLTRDVVGGFKKTGESVKVSIEISIMNNLEKRLHLAFCYFEEGWYRLFESIFEVPS